MDVDARLEVVEIENEMLREQIRKLETMLGVHFGSPLEFGLTGSEECVFGVLMLRELATKEMISIALYNSLGKEAADEKIVDVFVCKIRAKIKAFGIEIKTMWGKGYYLTPETKRTVKTLLDARAAA